MTHNRIWLCRKYFMYIIAVICANNKEIYNAIWFAVKNGFGVQWANPDAGLANICW